MPRPDRRSYAPGMTAARSALVVVLALVAALTGLMLVSLQYGLAETYDSGGSGLVFLLAAIPLGAALVGGSVAGSEGRTIRAGLVIFAVVLVVALVAAAPLGARAHDRQLVEQDRTFSCNGPNAEAHVDERVDAAFHEFPHPALLYGPIEGSRYGCTAGIYDPAGEGFDHWREVLLGSGWTVSEDAERIRVTRGGLVAVLSQDGGTALLRITADEPTDCDEERTQTSEGQVVGC